jgi:hypothetical protein
VFQPLLNQHEPPLLNQQRVFQPHLNQREPPLLNQQRVFQLLLNQHEPPLLNQQRESHQQPSQTHLISSLGESLDGSDVDAVQPLDYDDYGKVLVHQPKTKLDITKEVETMSFAFDNVFVEKANNVGIYERSLKSLISGVFRGKWASVFAYGQTGSVKTVLSFAAPIVFSWL